MKTIIKQTFWYLLTIYAILILIISIGLFSKYSLQFQIFALIIAIFGISILNKKAITPDKQSKNTKLHTFALILLIIIIIFFRLFPYLTNPIPLGYDAGLYKYGIEHGLENLDKWIIQGGMEPGFLYLMKVFSAFLSVDFILKYLLIAFCALLGFLVYIIMKEFSGKKSAALIALSLFAFSIIQLKTFSYMYYKNIIGMCFMLFSVYLILRYEKTGSKICLISMVLFSGLLGAIHRPTFYIFGLSYLIYALINLRKTKTYFISGFFILLIASLFYIGKFSQAVTTMFGPLLQGFLSPGESPGTFISFLQYQFSSLFYLPLAFLGLFYFLKNKKFNFIVIWTVINLAWIYLQFFFFNRSIIFLDLALIMMAGIGFSVLIKNKRNLGIFILCILLCSGSILAFKESASSNPLINENELDTIKQLSITEENAYVMSTSSIYSPWLLGYSERRTIAPGMFDYNKHTEEEWRVFWKTQNIEDIKNFMNVYKKPLYIFIGQKQRDNLKDFPECFSKIYNLSSNYIYSYIC